jgi:hypothetical protein
MSFMVLGQEQQQQQRGTGQRGNGDDRSISIMLQRRWGNGDDRSQLQWQWGKRTGALGQEQQNSVATEQ